MRGRLAALVAALAGLAVAGATCAPTTHADNPDQQYLAALAAMGVNGDPAALIAAGHASCDQIGQVTVSMFGLTPASAQLMAAGVPYAQLQQASVAGARVYCPDKLHSLGLS